MELHFKSKSPYMPSFLPINPKNRSLKVSAILTGISLPIDVK